MRLCYIANANSIHTWRWIAPLFAPETQVHLLSYTPVTCRWTGLAQLIDLTRLSNYRKLRFLLWGLWIHQYVRRLKPDILHAHELTAAGWLGVIANYHPFVVSAWGSDILIEPHRSTLRRNLIKLVTRRCDRLTVPSQPMYDAARALGTPDARLRLIPWGVETDIFHPFPDDRKATRKQFGIDSSAGVVLCPRGIAPIYNIDIIVEAFKSLAAKVPEAQLVLMRFNADLDYAARTENLIDELGLTEKVHWLPPQDTPWDMARLYRMSDVVISIPSSEGYGFSVYEAMATGCPTVITDLPAFDLLEQSKHTEKVSVRDVRQTEQALLRLLTDANLAQRLRKHSLDVGRKLSIEARVNQSLALYTELLA
jgi:glycosyltransferase involved in cell wall biosynthesis